MQKKPLKILQIGYLDPTANYGGVQKYIEAFVKLLSERDDFIIDILCAGNANGEKIIFRNSKVIFLNVPFFSNKNLYFISKYFYGRKVRDYIFKSMDKYDVFHFHGDNGLIDETYSKKSILTLHGFVRGKETLQRNLTTFIPSRIELNNVKKASIVFSVSKEAKDYFQPYRVKPIILVNQMVDTSFYEPVNVSERENIRKELGFPPNSINGLILGSDPIRKGLDVAIEAITKINREDIYLTIIGFPRINEYSPNIRELDGVSEVTKLKYMIGSDFFILPSLKEGFPISALEAAAVGLPIIVSVESGVSVLKDITPYYEEIKIPDHKFYSEAILKLADLIGRGLIKRPECKRSGLDEYSEKTIVEKYLVAYMGISEVYDIDY